MPVIISVKFRSWYFIQLLSLSSNLIVSMVDKTALSFSIGTETLSNAGRYHSRYSISRSKTKVRSKNIIGLPLVSLTFPILYFSIRFEFPFDKNLSKSYFRFASCLGERLVIRE